MTLLEQFEQRTNEQMAKIQHLIGTEYPDIFGNTWVLHSCNDLGIPYFHKKGRKTLFTVSHCRHIDLLI